MKKQARHRTCVGLAKPDQGFGIGPWTTSRLRLRFAAEEGFLSTGVARQVVREIRSSGDRQNAVLLPELSLIVKVRVRLGAGEMGGQIELEAKRSTLWEIFDFP